MGAVIIGEALIDLLITPQQHVTVVTGGGPFNQARTIAKLDEAATFIGGISSDRFGQQIASQLAADNVTTCLPPHQELKTTLALAELDDHGAASYRFYFEGTAATQLAQTDIQLPTGTKFVSIGTLGMVLEPIASTLEHFAPKLSADYLLFFDPNSRPAAIPERETYLARIGKILSRADIVKVSSDDLEYLHPGEDAITVAQKILAFGVKVVLHTDGANSVRITTPTESAILPVPKVTIADTVGAGDAFGGGFIAFWMKAGYHRNELNDFEKVVSVTKQAIEVAAITCSRIGANPPRLTELNLTK